LPHTPHEADPAPAQPDVFFDGESNRRHLVQIRCAGELEIQQDGVRLASWPFTDIRTVDAPADTLRLCCVTAPPLARLELRDPSIPHSIERLCPALSGPGGAQPISIARIATWSLAATAVIVGMIWFGVPVLADHLTEAMPIAWKRPLGKAVDKQVRALFSRVPCTRPEGQAALTKLISDLQSAARLPVAPDPVVLNSPIPNAFAVPGGRVYILSGLLARALSPDELAGVLAHEFGHVSHRDGVRRLIRNGGTAFLVGLLFGDISGAGAALFTARSLPSAAYSRDIEAVADGFAITVMHRLGRPTAPLGNLLLRLGGPGNETFALLQDHPLTPERAQRLEEADAPASGPPLLSATEWQELRMICMQPPLSY
jgi:Zn-dependent protease with chaperone function